MVKVDYYLTNDMVRIEAKGHATGRPEVCAAISALLGAWSVWVDQHYGSVHEESGDYSGDCYRDLQGMTQTVSDTIIDGIERVRLSAQDSVTVVRHDSGV